MNYQLDLTKISPKHIYPLAPRFTGSSPNGEKLSFTNYYMQLNNAPTFGICGEIHFSRVFEDRWQEAILKMKAGGITTIATYIFWNHHEEEEGTFDFNGRRNLRRFVELCGQHGLYVIARIGPFDHGEVRNGGLPDWLYGKPFEVRSLDEGFLSCTRKLYHQLSLQLQGLLYKDGGPVIAAQIDNEYMHSAAPWELTTGVSNEWLPSGNQGEAYMLKLQGIAKEEGIDVPFYTCTGWGGAATPEDMMPLWGGYAFRPWIFYTHKGEHPPTEEYIYRDNHNNDVPATYNFEPCYKPESKPYLCCEMGGGMTCCYYYRFQLPFESVDAMANIKIGSGCNMLGYYMYHGGTNPKSKRGVFLNEGQVPKMSYDYQAALGEFGQVRDSYRRLRALHLFAKSFEQVLCKAKTVLPEGSQEIQPEDNETLRYAVRITETGEGFLFLNNYQDHARTLPKENETVTLRLPGEEIVFEGISLDKKENCVLPFNLDVGGVKLHSAMAQPLTVLEDDGVQYAFFFVPRGMTPSYTFPADTVIKPAPEKHTVISGGLVRVDVKETEDGHFPVFTAVQGEREVRFVTLNRGDSLRFSVVNYQGRKVAVITEGVLTVDGDEVRLEHDMNAVSMRVLPDGVLPMDKFMPEGNLGAFAYYRMQVDPVMFGAEPRQVGPSRYVLDAPTWDDPTVKDVILHIRYLGDIGSAFIDGDMISDNFYNGAPWEIGLREFRERLKTHPLTIYITPIKEGQSVNVESVMAGRREENSAITAAIAVVGAKTIYEWRL